MEKPASSPRSFAIRTAVFVAVVFVIPFPFYWWSLSTGALPPEAEWYAGGRNHGPWRWQFPGMAVVLLPLYTLILGAPSIFAVGLWRSFRQRTAAYAAISAVLGAVALGLAHVQGSKLFWTID